MSRRLTFLGAYVFAVFAVITVLMIAKPGKAEAFIAPFYNDPGWSIPGFERDILNHCDERVPLQSPGFVRWISLEGNPLAQSADVPYGTPSIRLQLNLASVVCSNRSAVLETSYQFGPYISPGAESLWGQTTFINHTGFYGAGNFNVKGTYRQIAVPFTYAPAGGFTSSRDHVISIDTRTINHFTSNPQYLCVGNAANAGSFYNFAPCTITTPTFSLRVNVGEVLPTENLEWRAQGTCDALVGWAFDPDVPTRSIPVHVFLDYPTGDPRAQAFEVIANLPRPDVNAAYPATGNSPHGYSIDISRFHANGEARRYYLYYVSYDQAGVDRGNRGLEIVDVPACGRTFNLSPKGSVTLLNASGNPDDEDPATARFSNIGINASTVSVGGITVSPRYEVRKATGGPPIVLGPNPGPYTGVSVGAGGVTVLATDNRTVTGLTAGDRVCLVVTLNPGAGKVNTAGAVIAGSTTSITVDVACKLVSNKPYLSVYSGDVYAGGNFATTSATCNFSSPITGYLNSSGWGSGTQLAATALGSITGFNTASWRTSGIAPRPKGLSFANTPAIPGSFAGNNCIKNYFAEGAAAPTVPTIDLSTVPAGDRDYKITSPAVTLAGGTVPAGAHIRLYVEGTLNITGDIRFATNARANSRDIPSLQIVARNINISNSVQQLDGVYVAQPASGMQTTQGSIITCSEAAGNFDLLYGSCGNQLVVNGAFIANRVRFLRTLGSLRNAISDSPFGSRAGCAGSTPGGIKPTCAGEVFNFTPELYLTVPSTTTSSSTVPDDFSVQLPPIL